MGIEPSSSGQLHCLRHCAIVEKKTTPSYIYVKCGHTRVTTETRYHGNVLLLLALLSFAALAQTFEVDTVKLSPPQPMGHTSISLSSGHGRVTMTNVTLKRAVMSAYSLSPNQIFGGPSWLDSANYDIVAKASTPTDDDALLMRMLQSLLADRFKLVVHHETRTMQAYSLELLKQSPKLEKADEGEDSVSVSNSSMDAKHVDMDRFAQSLSLQLDHPVVNHTGLKGAFNFKLQWEPERADGPGATDRPSIFTAVQEQLGLRLRAGRNPVDTIVVDHAEQPGQN